MLKDLFTIAITNGIVLTIFAFLLKSIINHFLSKDIENYKIKIKADFERMAFEHQVRFSQLHEKRGVIIEELYEKLCEAIRAAGDFASPLESTGDKSKSDKSQVAWKALMDFYRYFDKKKIFLNEDTCDKINKLYLEIRNPIYDYAFFVNNPGENDFVYKGKFEAWVKAWDSIDKNEVPAARKALEVDFRKLLGAES
jgi:hypothetical protein